MQDLELRKMNMCSFQTALQVWNEGFHGYFIDLTLSLDDFLRRIMSLGISPEHSFIAFVNGQPVGFLLNGIRESLGKRYAWNGGTGVIPSFRGKGVGKMLVQVALDLYSAESVDVAMLEAISTNESAIALYKKFGYEILEELVVLQSDALATDLVSSVFIITKLMPAAVGKLEFYREFSPWQCQWQSVAAGGGEAVIAVDADRRVAGYALFERKFDESGKPAKISMYQCEVAPERGDGELVAASLLRHVFMMETGNCKRLTHNLRKTNQVVIDLLTASGFTTFIEQVHMIRRLS
ncbi:MAG: N-acetyltransferase [Acidobacteria bacterium]|nr:MAG: N-acetyltransferase [Acidobacteriota bacterium]